MTARSAAKTATVPNRGQLTRAVVLVIAGLVVYANGLGGPFVYDDFNAVVSNEQIRRLSPLSEPLSPPRDTPVAGRPLVNLSLAINYAVSGLDPRGYHVTNLAIHLLAALALFGVVRRTLDFDTTDALRTGSRDVAFVCALVWMLHPINTEVVNYVTQRTSSLMGLMYLLTLYCSIRALGRPTPVWQAAAVLACATGMACKESMATAPLMVAVYDRVFVYSSFREALQQRRSLYAGLVATWLVLVALLLQVPRTTVGFDAGVGAWTYLLNQAAVIVDYLRLTILPWGLVLDYGVPRPLTLPEVLVPALLVLGLGIATLIALARRPRLGFLGAWFFVTLAPTSSFVPIVTEVGAERRMYLPLAAIVVFAVCAAFRAIAARRVSKAVAVAVCSAVCVVLAVGTMLRNREYSSRLSLAQTVVERRPHGRAYLRLGSLLLEAGRRPEAIEYFQRAKRADALGARFVLGTEHLVDGDLQTGIVELEEFVRRYPTHPNVIAARQMLGGAYLAQGRLDDAAIEFTEILQEVPRHQSAHEGMGDILLQQDRPAEALTHLRFVAARRPGDVIALGKLGTALAAAGHMDEAGRVLSQAVTADPRHPQVRIVLGRVLAMQGRLPEAVVEFERAVELAPDNEAARRDLDAARSQADQRR